MRKLLLASTFLVAAAGTAFAADAVVYEEPAPVDVSFFSWTGGYVGIQGGYGWSDVDVSVGDGLFDGSFDPDGGFVGGLVGFNYQINQFVIGAEADINKAWIGDSVTVGPADVDADLEWFGSVRARAGVAFDRTLVFATGGVAFAHSDVDTNFGDDTLNFTGWTVGAGVEHAFTDNWTVRGEYRYYDFGNEDVGGLPLDANADFTMSTVSLGVAYKF